MPAAGSRIHSLVHANQTVASNPETEVGALWDTQGATSPSMSFIEINRSSRTARRKGPVPGSCNEKDNQLNAEPRMIASAAWGASASRRAGLDTTTLHLLAQTLPRYETKIIKM